MKLLTITIVALISLTTQASDLKLNLTPYAQYILGADITTRTRDGSNNKIGGEGFGFGLGTRIGVDYSYFQGGVDLNYYQMGTRGATNNGLVNAEAITARNFGPYVGLNYLNFNLAFSYYFASDATSADNGSYESDEDGIRLGLGYLFKDKYLLSFEYMNFDGYINPLLSDNDWMLEVEEVFALSISVPINLL